LKDTNEVSFTELYERLKGIDLDEKMKEDSREYIESAIETIRSLGIAEKPSYNKNDIHGEGLFDSLTRILNQEGIKSGKIAEIGGPFNSFADRMPNYDFTFLSIYPVEGDDRVQVADITACDYIPDNTYDVVFSKAVLEHVDKPWLAGEQISRILKPGGIAFHAAPFSYFYHGAPADYWRFTPDAFQVMMSELEPIDGWFIGNNRRKDNRGSPNNRVDQDGGEQFAVDAFGGWRENWSSVYVGRKNPSYLAEKRKISFKQVILDSIKGLILEGVSEEQAITKTLNVLDSIKIKHDGSIQFVKKGEGHILSLDEIKLIWKRRGRDGVKPGYARYKTPRILGLI